MQLTLYTDYVLRTLLYLGARPGEVVPVSAISAAHGVSVNHLSKVAKALARQGYVRTRRGKLGGIQLAREPEAIRLGELVRVTEPRVDLLACFDDKTNTCSLSRACRFQSILLEARAAFFDVLDRYTLADLLHNAPQLAILLGRAHDRSLGAPPRTPHDRAD